MAKMMKFASQLDEKSFRELKRFSEETGRSVTSIIGDAIEEYLARQRIRPAYRNVVEKLIQRNLEILQRLS